MAIETTVDFVIRFPSGFYLCRKKVNTAYKFNHLNATSFNTRIDAEKTIKALNLNAIVVKRTTILEG